MGDIARIVPALSRPSASTSPLSFDQWLNYFTFDGMEYPFGMGFAQTLAGNREELDDYYAAFVAQAYKANGVVFACLVTRLLIFSEARFQWRQLRSGAPGELFGTSALSILERPEPGRTTGDLLARMINDADLAGIGYVADRSKPGRPRLRRMRPDWVAMIIGSPNADSDFTTEDLDAELVGFVYQPGGPGSGADPVTLLPETVAWFAPIPDPVAKYRGVSLLSSIRREVMADSAATYHKLRFFEQGATPNMVVKFPPMMGAKPFAVEDARKWIGAFEQDHGGVLNAYKTAYIGGGADIQVVGKDLKQLDFKSTQGAGQTVIAAALGMHPAVVGLSEGLAGASLNAGNFGAARRIIADRTMRPNWRNAAKSLEVITTPPPSSELWWDERGIAFLREDVKDQAEILNLNAQSMRNLGDGGWEHDAVVDAVTSGDLRRLMRHHTGLVPVQLQPPNPDGTVPVARALGAFWPVTGLFEGAQIRAGEEFPADHPIVASFPQLFERTAASIAPFAAAAIAAPGRGLDARQLAQALRQAATAMLEPGDAPGPAQLGAGEVRCQGCGKLVARALGPGSSLDCPRCKAVVVA